MTTAGHSFIDFALAQFSPQNWLNGLSVYRSGGITECHMYEELVHAKIRTGIGERFDVRLKFHTSGRFIQWMECSCPANRRRGEKCLHLAAFCAYLYFEKQDYLLKINVIPGNIDKELLQEEGDSDAESYTDNEKPMQANDARPVFKTVAKQYEIKHIEPDTPEPWLCVKAYDNQSKKQLNFRIGIDDAYEVLFSSHYSKVLDASLVAKQNKTVTGNRILLVKKHDTHNLKILRCIHLQHVPQNDIPPKSLPTGTIEPASLGYKCFYTKADGYVKFDDDLTSTQIMAWMSYPNERVVTGEQVAKLIAADFYPLRSRFRVVVEEDVNSNILVEQNITLSDISIQMTAAGEFVLTSDTSEKDDQKTSLIEILQARTEGKRYLEKKYGFLKIPPQLDWLKDKIHNNKIVLSAIDFIRLHEQQNQLTIKSGEHHVQSLLAGLVSRSQLSAPSLKNTNLSLRPYQEEGFLWLWWLYSNALGGLLADDMGLGKTHQAMALMAAVAATNKQVCFLIVCPTTVLDHWVDKLNVFVPSLPCHLYHGAKRALFFKDWLASQQSRVLVTSYGILMRDISLLSQIRWEIVILDEAHLVKNKRTRIYHAACHLTSRMRLCLTGTPLENDLIELKTIFDYILPNYLGSEKEFKRKYTFAADQKQHPLQDIELQRLIHPFKMRRHKSEVLNDLPEKIEDVRYCRLNKVQQNLYLETLELKGKPLVLTLKDQQTPVSYVHIFSIITLLKQICDDPGLVDARYDKAGSGKLELFDDILTEALQSDSKIVVFTQYARMVSRLSQRLSEQNIEHVTLTGQTQNRGAVVKKFQTQPQVRVFLSSLLAGGTGIDLTAACTVIHFDRWWNAAKEDQATDRVHRIGQTKHVYVYKLVTKDTLEERIDALISKKKRLFERFVENDEQVFKHLSREELLDLLTWQPSATL